MKKAKTSKKSPRYRKTPSQKYSLGGDIGAGFAGVAKGIVGTVLPGPLGSMAMQGVDAIHGALDEDITNQEKAILGYGQAAGAAGTAIVSGGALTGQAIGVGASGLSTGVSNTGNGDDPNMQMLAQGVNLAGQIGGMAYGNAQDKKLAEGGKLGDPPYRAIDAYNDSLMLHTNGMTSNDPVMRDNAQIAHGNLYRLNNVYPDITVDGGPSNTAGWEKPTTYPKDPNKVLIEGEESSAPNYDTDLSASLKKQGRDRSFAARKKIAIEAGIDNYNGTVEQNIALLKAEKARGFDLSKPIKVEGFEKVEPQVRNELRRTQDVQKTIVPEQAVTPVTPVTPEAPIQTQEVQQNRGDQVQYNQVITGYKQVFNPETSKYERKPVDEQQGSRVRGAKINNNPNATTQYAEGGQMQQNMNNGQEQLNQFNGGGTHEENPVGGIPMGNGQSVEAGETELTSENYVFSDRLKSNKVLAEEFGYKHSDKTFAELSKSIDKKYSTRTSDSMDEESKKRELSRLMEAQEAMKEEKMQKDLAKFEKAQPELFAQMQAQAQQAAQGQGQPQQQQMPEGGMPQGMGQPGQMAMGGYRKNNDRQYAEGGPGDLGKLYQMYRNGIITKEQLDSHREDLDMGVNIKTIYDQINYEQTQNTPEATPLTTEAQQQAANVNTPVSVNTPQAQQAQSQTTNDSGKWVPQPDGGSLLVYDDPKLNSYDYKQSQDALDAATPFTPITEAQKQIGQQPSEVNPMVTPAEEGAQGSNTASPSTMAGGTGLDLTNENMSAADGTVTDGAADSTVDGAEDSGYQEPEGFKPGLANQVGQFAPIAYNLYQGLKKEDTLNAGDYMTNERIDPATMNIDPTLRANNEGFQGTLNAVRSGAGGSGGSYLANMQQAQLNKQKGDANAFTQKSNYDNQQRVSADMANIRLDQQNNQIRRGVDDFNLRSKATKENALGDAANNIASLTTANTQTKANAYGYSKMAPMYDYMFNNYVNKNKKGE